MPVWVKWVLAGTFVAALALAVLGYMIYEHGFLEKKSSLLNGDNCTKTSFLNSSIKSDTKKSEFRSLCAKHYSQMSEAEFDAMVGSFANTKSLLLELGKMYDGSLDDSFLKEMWPNVEAETTMAVYYYSQAKVANVSGASKLLKDACSRLETPTEQLLAFKDCKEVP